MSNLVIIPKSNKHMDYFLDKDIYGFILPIKDLSMGYEYYIDMNDIEDIVGSYPNKKIIISLNKTMHNNDIDNIYKLFDIIKNINIDKILYCDDSIYNIAKNYNMLDKLVIYKEHMNTSILSNQFYLDMGINCSYISNDITISEINDIKDNTNIKLFMTVYGYLKIFYSRRYLISNYLEYINKDKNDNLYYLLSDNNEYYPIYEEEYGTSIYTHKCINLLNKIDELKKIDYLVLDSFNIEENTFNDMVNKYINKDMIDDEYLGFFNEETIYKVKSSNEGDKDA